MAVKEIIGKLEEISILKVFQIIISSFSTVVTVFGFVGECP